MSLALSAGASRTVLSTPRIWRLRAVIGAQTFSTAIPPTDGPKKERVVILGSGWAGYAFARTLNHAKYDAVVVSPRSHFVFTPLLASTAVGTLEFRAILESVRRLDKNVAFHQGWADDVDFTRKIIRVEENTAQDPLTQQELPPSPREASPPPKSLQAAPPRAAKGPVHEVPYDKLVVAVGSYSQTFGIEGVREHASFLRDIGDARKIRLRVLALFEQCTSLTMSNETRRKLLHFAIVGGGPTGIEYAAELHDLIHDDLSKIYPTLMQHVAITVYDVAPKILPMFEQTLADYAMRVFQRQHITVKTGTLIQRVRPDPDGAGGLSLKVQGQGDVEVGAGIVVWSTGLMQNPLVEKLVQRSIDAGAGLRLEKDPKTGGIIVDDRFRARLTDATTTSDDSAVAKTTSSSSTTSSTTTTTTTSSSNHQVLDDVFVIGDCAVVDTQPTLPKTAQVASQEAAFLARALNKASGSGSRNLADVTKPFKFRNLGTMTYVGSWRAIHQHKANRLTGWVAWVVWRTAYLTKSMSLRNKVLVPVYWFVSWVFGRDISRF